MRPPIKNVLRQEDVSNAFTKGSYHTNIFTQFLHRVKLYRGRVLQSFRKNEAIVAPIQFSQKICDPTGVKIHVALAPPRVFITDENGSVVEFSAYLVPDLRASLLEVESKFGGCI